MSPSEVEFAENPQPNTGTDLLTNQGLVEPQKPQRRKFRIFQEEEGSLLLFSKYLDRKDQFVQSRFWDKELYKENITEERRVYTVPIGGELYFVKPKGWIRSYAATRRQHLSDRMELLRAYHPDTPENELPGLLQQHDLKTRAAVSIGEELSIIEDAKNRYREQFNEDLPIEEPVAAFVRRNKGRYNRCTVYKNLGKCLDKDELIGDPKWKQEYQDWVSLMAGRMSQLGFLPYDFQGVGIPSQDGNSIRFTIIDTQALHRSI